MKNHILLSLVVGCLFFQNISSAGEQTSDVQSIRFEDLKVACLNPSRFHNQIAPSNIQISCSEIRAKWIPDEQGKLSLPSKRVVLTSVISNKYSVSPISAEVAVEPTEAVCSQYKQVIETVESLHNATCEKITAFEGTAQEYCAQNLDVLRVDNPAAIKVQETGKKTSLCSLKMQE